MAKAVVTKAGARKGANPAKVQPAQQSAGNPFQARQKTPPALGAGLAALQKAQGKSKAKVRADGPALIPGGGGGGGGQGAAAAVNAKRNARGGMRPFSNPGGASRGKAGG